MTILKCFTLAAGLMFGGKRVTAQDLEKGVAAYDSGDFQTVIAERLPLAEQSNAAAQYNLGLMYLEGNGVPQDYAEAIKWYCLAADQGDSGAQSNLGLMYEHGYGVFQDNVKAHMSYNIISANGYKMVAEWRDKIAARMKGANLSKAQAMASECMSSSYESCGC
jgi:TPR repeat protein